VSAGADRGPAAMRRFMREHPIGPGAYERATLTRAAEAAEGVPVTPVAYLVVAGAYDDTSPICVCADECDADERAERWNRENFPRDEHDAARVEPIEYVPARGPAAVAPAVFRVSPGLPDLPGVPAEVGPVACVDCDQRTATVRHVSYGGGGFGATLVCSGCGGCFDLLAEGGYLTGLTVGVLVESARRGDPRVSRSTGADGAR
jgi:hypothetical protein